MVAFSDLHRGLYKSFHSGLSLCLHKGLHRDLHRSLHNYFCGSFHNIIHTVFHSALLSSFRRCIQIDFDSYSILILFTSWNSLIDNMYHCNEDVPKFHFVRKLKGSEREKWHLEVDPSRFLINVRFWLVMSSKYFYLLQQNFVKRSGRYE